MPVYNNPTNTVGTPQAFGSQLPIAQGNYWETSGGGPSPSQVYADQQAAAYGANRTAAGHYQDQQNRQRAQDLIAEQQRSISNRYQGAEQERIADTYKYTQGRRAAGDEQRGKFSNTLYGALSGLQGAGGGYGGSSSALYGSGALSPQFQFSTPPREASAPGLTRVIGNEPGAAATAAHAAEFGKAKAQAGSLGQAAMRGLQSSLAERGLSGSGVGARGLVRQLGEATNPLSDMTAAQLRANIAEYQGGLTQRGQNVSERGQDISEQGMMAQSADERARLALQATQFQQGQKNNNFSTIIQALSGLNSAY